MESYADEAENRLEQDLMLLSNGHRTRDLLRRLKQYKDFIVSPGAENTEFAQKYKQRIQAASAAPAALGTYVPGDEIEGDELRKFSDEPIICGPLVCQLCNKDFISEKAFADHKKNAHAKETEYRKRVPYLMSQDCYRRITGQENSSWCKNSHTSSNTAFLDRWAILLQTVRKFHGAKRLVRSVPGKTFGKSP